MDAKTLRYEILLMIILFITGLIVSAFVWIIFFVHLLLIEVIYMKIVKFVFKLFAIAVHCLADMIKVVAGFIADHAKDIADKLEEPKV